jgi:hypothetical protein
MIDVAFAAISEQWPMTNEAMYFDLSTGVGTRG